MKIAFTCSIVQRREAFDVCTIEILVRQLSACVTCVRTPPFVFVKVCAQKRDRITFSAISFTHGRLLERTAMYKGVSSSPFW